MSRDDTTNNEKPADLTPQSPSSISMTPSQSSAQATPTPVLVPSQPKPRFIPDSLRNGFVAQPSSAVHRPSPRTVRIASTAKVSVVQAENKPLAPTIAPARSDAPAVATAAAAERQFAPLPRLRTDPKGISVKDSHLTGGRITGESISEVLKAARAETQAIVAAAASTAQAGASAQKPKTVLPLLGKPSSPSVG